jgi:hypothetical protein
MIRYFTVLSRRRIGKAPQGKEHSWLKLIEKERKEA